MDAGHYRFNEIASFMITPDREGSEAVVRGIAYLRNRPVAVLAGSSFADTGWHWTMRDGAWHPDECG
jgi:hypothetical protein